MRASFDLRIRGSEFAGTRLRIAPGGSLYRGIRRPVSQPTSCYFEDLDLKTPYVSSPRHRSSVRQLRREPLAGGVFSVRVPVTGIKVFPFVDGRMH